VGYHGSVSEPAVDGLRYELSLTLDPGSLDFEGSLVVRGRDLGPELELDSLALTIVQVTVDGAASPYALDADAGRLRIPGLPDGAPAIEVVYRGRVDDVGATGLYRSPLGE
jgi:aminopeptidase N